ncbi:cbb3-type cytochrome c oxidase subunit II [Opitutales bacterium]|nr:cbb3-type cytochrome c oxidase subunit II [Opitutales bacterium]
MNNLAKFTIGIFLTLGMAWLAFVVGARSQFGDLVPTSEVLEDDGSVPVDAELFPTSLSGMAKQGAEEYAALGCVTCHTQQVRRVEAGFDVERGWGKRPSAPRDYVLQEHVLLGNSRIGPDLANVGLREHSDNWLHQHLFEPQSIFPSSLCPPSPFLYQQIDEPVKSDIEIVSNENADGNRFVRPTVRASRLVSYLQELKQDYELPEVSFVEVEEDVIEEEVVSTDISVVSTGAPKWLQDQIDTGKEIYMKAAPGGGMCFTCHQQNGQGLAGQFPPLAGSDWVLGDKERLIKISMYGLMGEIEVNGVKYNNVMAPPGIPPGSLTDEQIASVLTYIRNDWGNSASAVSAEEVATVRESLKGRAPMQMFTAAELTTPVQ